MGSSTGDPLRVACRSETAGQEVPHGVCARFAERAAAATGRQVAIVSGREEAEFTLVVIDQGARVFHARIDRPGLAGEPLATARRDAPLDAEARTALIDALLAAMRGP